MEIYPCKNYFLVFPSSDNSHLVHETLSHHKATKTRRNTKPIFIIILSVPWWLGALVVNNHNESAFIIINMTDYLFYIHYIESIASDQYVMKCVQYRNN
jgi:hypothetical protein